VSVRCGTRRTLTPTVTGVDKSSIRNLDSRTDCAFTERRQHFPDVRHNRRPEAIRLMEVSDSQLAAGSDRPHIENPVTNGPHLSAHQEIPDFILNHDDLAWTTSKPTLGDFNG